jgi:hypothetical protein
MQQDAKIQYMTTETCQSRLEVNLRSLRDNCFPDLENVTASFIPLSRLLLERSVLSGAEISSTHLRVATWEQVSESFSLSKGTPWRESSNSKGSEKKVMNRKG